MATLAKPGGKTSALGISAVLGAVLAWSVTNTLLKVSSTPALEFALYRLWVGAAALLAVCALMRRRLTLEIVKASAPGGALLGIEIAFFFSAIKSTNVADVMVIAALQPALVLLVAGRLFGETVTRREVVWTAVSVGGVVLVAAGSVGTPAFSVRGDLLAVGSLIAWTTYFLVSKRARSRVPALEYMTVVTLTSALVITPLALLSGQPLEGVHGSGWVWLLLFVVGASGGHLLVAWAHAYVDVTISSLLMLALPVLSSIAALLILNEALTPLELLGMILVVGSLAAIVTKVGRPGAEEEISAAEVPQL